MNRAWDRFVFTVTFMQARNPAILVRKPLHIICFIISVGVFSSCMPVNHFLVTRSTQKWEKDHFNPSRKSSGSKKKVKKKGSKPKMLKKRIG